MKGEKNVKKILSFILVLLMLVSGSMSVFADETDVPKDIQGTEYESAVRTLIEKGVLSGYSDGTFRPDAAMDRAEACAVVVKAMNPVGAELYNAKNNVFEDMNGYEWASKYVSYAVSKGIVSGTSKTTFKPADQVTNNEIAAMLVNAVGYTAKDLQGSWPDNYVNKAKELMIFSAATLQKDGNAAATRGDVALMTATVAEKIEIANKNRETITITTTDGAIDNGKLTGNTGRSYGMILDAKGTYVSFLMGNRIYQLPVAGNVSVPNAKQYLSKDGNLYGFKTTDGVIQKIDTDGTSLGSKRFYEFTAGKFDAVKGISKGIVTTDRGTFTVEDSSIFYVMQVENGIVKGYEPGTIRDIQEGRSVRAYDLTNDNKEIANVVIIANNEDAAL